MTGPQLVTEFSGREFAAGVVTGVRSFNVDPLARLTGMSYMQVWTPGENTAECRSETRARTQQQYEQMVADHKRQLEHYHREMRNVAGVYPQSSWMQPLSRAMLMGPPPKAPQPPLSPDEHSMAECSCGFYGYYDGSDDYRRDSSVSAVVEGYGEVVIGSRGFRAGKARIVALCFLTSKNPSRKMPQARRTWERVARNYPDVPTFTRFAAMVAEFPPDRGLEQSPENDPDFWTRK